MRATTEGTIESAKKMSQGVDQIMKWKAMYREGVIWEGFLQRSSPSQSPSQSKQPLTQYAPRVFDAPANTRHAEKTKTSKSTGSDAYQTSHRTRITPLRLPPRPPQNTRRSLHTENRHTTLSGTQDNNECFLETKQAQLTAS